MFAKGKWEVWMGDTLGFFNVVNFSIILELCIHDTMHLSKTHWTLLEKQILWIQIAKKHHLEGLEDTTMECRMWQAI